MFDYEWRGASAAVRRPASQGLARCHRLTGAAVTGRGPGPAGTSPPRRSPCRTERELQVAGRDHGSQAR